MFIGDNKKIVQKNNSSPFLFTKALFGSFKRRRRKDFERKENIGVN